MFVLTGNCPTVTRATGTFLRRCGWLPTKAPQSQDSSFTAIAESAESFIDVDQLIKCKLVVGSCQLSTILQIVENMDPSDGCELSKWHIHIGKNDFEALQGSAWDLDTCYLAVKPEPGKMQ